MGRLKKVGQIVRKIIFVFFVFCSVGITYTLAKAVGENHATDQMIATFIARAETLPEEITTNYGYTWNYFPIERIYDYEISDDRDIFYDDAKRELGQFGDILLTRQSAFKDIPLIHEFISYYFGGHTAFRDKGAGLYETTGLNIDFKTLTETISSPGYDSEIEGASVQHINSNYWFDPSASTQYAPFYRTEMMSVRVKGVTEIQLEAAKEYLDYQILHKSLYNFLFWLDMDEKHYCTDLVSRAYQNAFYPLEEQKNYSRSLNDDGFITSVNDILLSRQTYLTSFTQVDIENECFNIYYLKDVA